MVSGSIGYAASVVNSELGVVIALKDHYHFKK